MGTVRVQGACLVGTGAELVTVEARFEGSDTKRTEVVISGLPDPVIRESRGRVLCALEECGLAPPAGSLFLNLAPAARRKTGGTLDLPLALGAAAAAGHLAGDSLRDTLFVGELGIDGRLHDVPGGLAVADEARRNGLTRVIGPPATAREVAHVPSVRSYGARNLAQVVAHLSGAGPGLTLVAADPEDASDVDGPSLDDVRGQAVAKRALAVAAAGGHALLLVGPPGAGKSMLARRLTRLLPAPSIEERIEITRVLSAVGRWPGGIVRARPFRAPHHTTSHAGLVGGGSIPQPGEITLAHRGLLFLDELPEFGRDAIEALREPIESGQVTISRANGRVELPARFQLVAAMNPCPCGYRGHGQVVCHCSPREVDRYRRRLSGPFLDRIDLRLEVAPTRVAELATSPRNAAAPRPTERELRAAVARALEVAVQRQGGRRNGELAPRELDLHAPLSGEVLSLVERAITHRHLSGRAVQALRRVARTIADLEGRRRLAPRHLAEAIALRAPWP